MKELNQLAQELIRETPAGLTYYEALQIAVQIQKNEILKKAFVVVPGSPSALEKIAMELSN